MMLMEKLTQIMHTHNNLMRDLYLVRELGLPDWCIAAGYVRNYVWDYLHCYSNCTPLNDVDVLYYDPYDLSEDSEKKYETILKNNLQEYNWSCKNQARMHLRNDDKPYKSVADAMKRWPETATAVGIRLDKNMNIEIIAPHGLKDLFNLVIRRSPHYKDREYFCIRVRSKKWLETWPRLRFIEDQ
ncbi:nucleotidyltransferase family protein [Paenibacillus alkalitolerans]|uniref:nucleotidyltransferase family protein n=1 Tax=Paenibacillus alkalitolerans TaxID=2799335 RepID=UPI001F22F566|nr:nucleotidyltransferase family protein [Paenibacillus alkalitolerans]